MKGLTNSTFIFLRASGTSPLTPLAASQLAFLDAAQLREEPLDLLHRRPERPSHGRVPLWLKACPARADSPDQMRCRIRERHYASQRIVRHLWLVVECDRVRD